jgi:hypothetical protein
VPMVISTIVPVMMAIPIPIGRRTRC